MYFSTIYYTVIFRFDLDPHERHTFWALTIGSYFVWLAPYTVDQQMVQRFSSARSLKDAKTYVSFISADNKILIS